MPLPPSALEPLISDSVNLQPYTAFLGKFSFSTWNPQEARETFATGSLGMLAVTCAPGVFSDARKLS